MENHTVRNLIKLNISIGVLTVIFVSFIISDFKLYLANVLFIDIIAIILGMSFAVTMFLWVIGITKA
ncbi:hypothetical protein [Ferroplasma sp.]|uniref:hypothetical protein n=1 Tax=Ferroplasma sp. TaxID=2591003 RepID=UPI00260915FE|nr:hypothetical protein [Ferroplasma sp.]MCL4453232.1 hypothetical protein [Candidatus Thermoplasmatota archaeon]